VLQEAHKRVFDEQALAKLLEAAYVVQEHNRQQARDLRILPSALPEDEAPDQPRPSVTAQTVSESGPSAKDDYTLTLAQIVATQHQIHVRRLELDNALALVAQRVTEITRADGAAIAFVDGGTLRYKAAAGLITPPVDTEIPLQQSLCLECVRTGQVVRREDLNLESLFGAEDWPRRGIQGLIAVPIYHDSGIAGALELYYAARNAFTEQDVHTCQLMAGLVTEALARDEQLAWKKSLASERAVMLETLEKLKPNLAALVDSHAARDSRVAVPAETWLCRKCGHELVEEEQFCGHCGSPRSSNYNKPPTAQTKATTAGDIHQAIETDKRTPPTNGSSSQPRPTFEESLSEKALADSIEEEMPELFAPPEFQTEKARSEEIPGPRLGAKIHDVSETTLAVPQQTIPETSDANTEEADNEDDGLPSTAILPRPEPSPHWTSAAAARDFLEQLAETRPPTALARFWNARRGDFYLAIAVILVACVIRWGIWADHSVAPPSPATAAAAHSKASPDNDLSLFDRMLIKLGLAEAPEPPENKGNPATQVWVDLHTALYYCPGTDLYGKTPNGKFTTQRDAQLDQFEPAYRKACN
jgi:putative methionine-R-sulfoxide reductase with GAF domain/ribosomal protein L37E